MPQFHRLTETEQVLRAIYQELGLYRHPDPGPDPQNLLAPVLTRLHNIMDALDAVNHKLTTQDAAINAVKIQLANNTAALIAIETVLSGQMAGLTEEDKAGLAGGLAILQQTNAMLQAEPAASGLSDDDKAGLAAGLAQLQKTNAALQADAAAT